VERHLLCHAAADGHWRMAVLPLGCGAAVPSVATLHYSPATFICRQGAGLL